MSIKNEPSLPEFSPDSEGSFSSMQSFNYMNTPLKIC